MFFTVVLLWPDYIADEFGHDTYITYVEADSPSEAITAARKEAMAPQFNAIDCPEDLYPIFVAHGHHDNLAP